MYALTHFSFTVPAAAAAAVAEKLSDTDFAKEMQATLILFLSNSNPLLIDSDSKQVNGNKLLLKQRLSTYIAIRYGVNRFEY